MSSNSSQTEHMLLHNGCCIKNIFSQSALKLTHDKEIIRVEQKSDTSWKLKLAKENWKEVRKLKEIKENLGEVRKNWNWIKKTEMRWGNWSDVKKTDQVLRRKLTCGEETDTSRKKTDTWWRKQTCLKKLIYCKESLQEVKKTDTRWKTLNVVKGGKTAWNVVKKIET